MIPDLFNISITILKTLYVVTDDVKNSILKNVIGIKGQKSTQTS